MGVRFEPRVEPGAARTARIFCFSRTGHPTPTVPRDATEQKLLLFAAVARPVGARSIVRSCEDLGLQDPTLGAQIVRRKDERFGFDALPGKNLRDGLADGRRLSPDESEHGGTRPAPAPAPEGGVGGIQGY